MPFNSTPGSANTCGPGCRLCTDSRKPSPWVYMSSATATRKAQSLKRSSFVKSGSKEAPQGSATYTQPKLDLNSRRASYSLLVENLSTHHRTRNVQPITRSLKIIPSLLPEIELLLKPELYTPRLDLTIPEVRGAETRTASV